jgi:SnoaL-like domain
MSEIPYQIANFFTAMQAGRNAKSQLEALFAEDAVYIEPFSGQPQSHSGRTEIIAAFAGGWDYPLPDMHVKIDHAETAGSEVRIRWTCFSSGLPGGKGSGLNHYTMSAAGLIERLETTLDAGE